MQLVNQKIEIVESMGYTINEFVINEEFQIQNLINAKIFDTKLCPIYIQNSSDGNDSKGYLKGLFHSEKLEIGDFKTFPKDSIFYYLDGFSENLEEWGEDKFFFKKLLNIFKNENIENLNDCFLINKEWFERNDSKIREREFTLYDFYFIIIWKHKNEKNKVLVSAWFCD